MTVDVLSPQHRRGSRRNRPGRPSLARSDARGQPAITSGVVSRGEDGPQPPPGTTTRGPGRRGPWSRPPESPPGWAWPPHPTGALMQVRDLVGVFTFGAPMATRRDYDMVGIRPEVPLGKPWRRGSVQSRAGTRRGHPPAGVTRVRLHRAHPGRAARGWSDGPAASPPSTGRPAAASRRRRPVAERRSAGRPSCARRAPSRRRHPTPCRSPCPRQQADRAPGSLSVTPPRVSATEVRDRQRCHVRRPADRVGWTCGVRDGGDARRVRCPVPPGSERRALPGWPRRCGKARWRCVRCATTWRPR